MESYFFLAEQFRTQDEPTFCPFFQIMHSRSLHSTRRKCRKAANTAESAPSWLRAADQGGLTTLAMVLNSLHIDPMRTWKGAWRWFNEQNLAPWHRVAGFRGPGRRHPNRIDPLPPFSDVRRSQQ